MPLHCLHLISLFNMSLSNDFMPLLLQGVDDRRPSANEAIPGEELIFFPFLPLHPPLSPSYLSIPLSFLHSFSSPFLNFLPLFSLCVCVCVHFFIEAVFLYKWHAVQLVYYCHEMVIDLVFVWTRFLSLLVLCMCDCVCVSSLCMYLLILFCVYILTILWCGNWCHCLVVTIPLLGGNAIILTKRKGVLFIRKIV